MHAVELRSAIQRVVAVLNKADILAVIKEYRAARGDDRAVAAARLGHAGAVIMENMDKFSENEDLVASAMYLDNMASANFWQAILRSAANPNKNASDLVHLYSRVLFASQHLPNLVDLLDSVEAAPPLQLLPTDKGEGRVSIRLSDAGEKASDPDRIARSIDGIDMLYSACASIARKPAMDLRLDAIEGSAHRTIHFVGERDSVSAVCAVIDSIAAAVEELHADDNINLDSVIGGLPIFQDLATLANVGTFTQNDLKDISETMQQGAMLVLESGVMLVDGHTAAVEDDAKVIASNGQVKPQAAPVTSLHERQAPSMSQPIPDIVDSGQGRDVHYERYLREREAMQRSAGPDATPSRELSIEEEIDAIDDLLKKLSEPNK